MNQSQYSIAKEALFQYIATLIDYSPLNDNEKTNATKHHVVALLTEEILNLSKDATHYDLYVLKPLLKSLLKIADIRTQEIYSMPAPIEEALFERIIELKEDYQALKLLISKIIEKEGI